MVALCSWKSCALEYLLLGLFKNYSTSEFNALPFMFMGGRHDPAAKDELFREFKLLKCLDDGNYKLFAIGKNRN